MTQFSVICEDLVFRELTGTEPTMAVRWPTHFCIGPPKIQFLPTPLNCIISPTKCVSIHLIVHFPWKGIASIILDLLTNAWNYTHGTKHTVIFNVLSVMLFSGHSFKMSYMYANQNIQNRSKENKIFNKNICSVQCI